MRVNRADLQKLAEDRVEDARILIDHERWAAAYYLLGYAVECGLKACVAASFREHEVPEKTIINEFYTHDVGKLLTISGLKLVHEKATREDAEFRINWSIVSGWNETFRYQQSVNEKAARELFKAVTDEAAGVLTWLKKHY